MIIQSTIDTLKAMRFSAMAGELEKQLNDPATYNSLGFEERLGLLIDAEWNRRQPGHISGNSWSMPGWIGKSSRKQPSMGSISIRQGPPE